MSRTFSPISINELETKMQTALTDDVDYHCLTPTIEKDLKKVKFDSENIMHDQNNEDLTGYHLLSNGLAIFGFRCGGDWEFPVWMCIYFDGKKLRGYIPKLGNSWNYDTKRAIGSDDVKDDKFLRKWIKKNRPNIKLKDEPLENDDADIMCDKDVLIKDIISRINNVSS